MKRIKLFLISLFALFMITGCASNRTSVTTKENIGFIQIVGNKAVYNGEITITVDNMATYEIDINSDEISILERNATYSIKPGAHSIVVSHNGKAVIARKVFITEQQIATVELP